MKKLIILLLVASSASAQFIQMGADSLKTNVPIRFTNIQEGAGKVLTSDNKGIATWQTPLSYWQINGTAGNELRNINTGGFWSAYPTTLPYNANNTSYPPTSPTSGNGTRMAWIPARSAFQAGTFNTNDGSVRFISENIGLFSFCGGLNAEARSRGGIALGIDAISDGTSNTIAFGETVRANGTNCLVMGQNSWANANNSILGGFNSSIQEGTSNTILFGESATANANNSYGLGRGLNMNTFGCLFLGSFNLKTIGVNPTTWVPTDPLFVLGNGQSDAIRSDAMVVQKNGIVNINTIPDNSTTYRLRVGGSISATSTIQANTLRATSLIGTGERDVCTDGAGNLIPCSGDSFYNVSAMGFHPILTDATPTTAFNRDVVKCLISFDNNTKSINAHAFAPVELPHGVTVTKLFFHYLQSAGDQMTLELYAVPRNLNGNGTIFVSIQSTVGTGILQSTGTPNNTLIIDNLNFYYYLKLSANANWQGSTMALRGVVFSYF